MERVDYKLFSSYRFIAWIATLKGYMLRYLWGVLWYFWMVTFVFVLQLFGWWSTLHKVSGQCCPLSIRYLNVVIHTMEGISLCWPELHEVSGCGHSYHERHLFMLTRSSQGIWLQCYMLKLVLAAHTSSLGPHLIALVCDVMYIIFLWLKKLFSRALGILLTL